MNRTLAAAAAALALLGTACRPEPTIERVPEDAYTPPSVTASPSGTATPPPALASGTPGASCVNGWREPAPGTALRSEPLDALRKSQGLTGTFHVVDMRYFTGPDDANLSPESKQKRPVERWYAKVELFARQPFRIRFLYVKRQVGAGIVAVAPYDTKGFAGKDWIGFDGEGGASEFEGVPGKWPGMPTDYRAAGELPPEVTGCLAGS